MADSSLQTATDEEGHFSLGDIPAGEYVVQISVAGYRAITKRFALAGGETKVIDVLLSPANDTPRFSVEVRPGTFESSRPGGPLPLTLVGNEVKSLGTTLANDPLRAVQALPGVTSDNDLDSRFSLRGADYRRVGLYLDGVLLRTPFHSVQGVPGASLTIFNGNLVDEMALYSGAFPARYADRTAGALDVHTREGNRQQFSARATASVSNADLLVEGPLGKNRRGAWLANARKSYLQYFIKHNGSNPTLSSGFTDFQSKFSYDLTPRHHLSLSLMQGFSGLDRGIAPGHFSVNSILTGDFRSGMVNLAWRYAPTERWLVSQHVAYLGERGGNLARNRLALSHDAYGEWVWNLDTTYASGGKNFLDFGWSLRRLRQDGFYNLRAIGGGAPLATWLSSNPFGILFNWLPTDLFGVLRPDEFHGTGLLAGGYLQQTWSASRGRWLFSTGLRWDRHSVNGIQTISPNGSVAFLPFRSSRFQLAWGQYAQFQELQVLFSPYGKTTLLPERATHVQSSFEQRLGERTRVRLEYYQRYDRDLLFRAFLEPRILRGRLFPLQLDAPVRNSARGYARGLQLFFQRRAVNGFTGWVSYALGLAGMHDGEAAISFPTDSDQRHTVNVYGSYPLRPSLDLSIKWIYGSGFPIPGFLRRQGDGVFLSESRNALRLEPYQRVDLRINKSYARERWRVNLFAEIINLFNRRNLAVYPFNGFNPTTGAVRLSRISQFPILPSLGVSLEF